MTRRVRFGAFIAGGLSLAVALVVLVGPHASSKPDGLNKVAIDHGLASSPTPRPADSSPIAGLVGVVATFALAGGVLVIVRRVSGRAPVISTE